MRVKSNISVMVMMMAGLVVLSGLIYGCYSKEVVAENKNIYGQDIKPNPLSDEELRKFAGSIRMVDGEAEAHYRLALHFQEKYRHKLAIEELKQVLQRNPAHFRAYNALGVSFDNLGDHDAAINSYKLALQIDPKLDYVYNNLGYAYLLKGDPQNAADAFQRAIALNEKEKRYRNNLGLVYVKQDKFELAFEQFKALDTDANAEKSLAKVMKDLGKGTATESVLLAVRSVPRKVDVAKPVSPAPSLPDLSAETSETTPGHDPIARFRSVTNGINTLRDLETDYDAQDPGISDKADAAAKESADDQDEFVAQVKEERIKKPVINTPPPPTQTNPYEIKIASAPVADPPKAAVTADKQETKYYHVSSVTFSRDVEEAKKPTAPYKKFDHQETLVTRELREILPPQIELASRMDQAEHEERILVAASSVKAGGWQNAPEPKRTAEMGLVEVEVANGNGTKGSAGKVAEHLRRNGFKVVMVVDAESHDHFNTKVFYYGGNLKEAQRLLETIPEITSDAELYELESMGNHIRLLIGKDLLERNKILSWIKPKAKR
jgi:tetratricopeptide (TPR) repeat protein